MFLQWVLLLFFIGSLDADYFRRSTCSIPKLEHGRVKTRQRTRLVQFNCLPGYTLMGNKYATCKDGEWDVPIPVCIRSGCKVEIVPNALHMTDSDNAAWVMYFCMPNHKLVGSHTLYCDGSKWNASAPVCVDSTAVSALSCDFESPGICGWTQDELHDFDWKRHNKKTPSSFLMTGPSYDHTYGKGGSGYYMYIESTSRLENDTARLISPVYDGARSKDACFSFYYHMFGNSTGGLRVYQKPDTLPLQSIINNNQDGKKYLLFEKWGNLGDFWYNGVVSLKDVDANFQIIIEGIRGSSFTSDIAIDDVAILTGENCTAAMMAAPTPPTFRSDSCVNRCFLNDTIHSIGCGCTFDCFMEENCCWDLLETCVFQHTTERTIDDMVTDTTDVVPQTEKLIAAITKTTSTSTTTTTTPRPTTTSTTTTTTPRPTTSTTRKPTTKRIVTKPPPPTTLARTTKTTTERIRTTIGKRVVTKPPTTSTTTTSTTTTTTTTTTPKTITSTTFKTTTLGSKATENGEPHFVDKGEMKNVVESRKLEHVPTAGEQHSTSAWKVVLILLGVITVIATVSLATVARSLRGRIALAKLRGASRNDSEVLYLPSDVDDD